MTGLRVSLLGPLEVRDADGLIVPIGAPKERGLLTLLALEPGRVHAPDTLIDRLWGDDPPRSAPNTLQSYVSRLRRTLGADVIRTSPAGYALDVPTDSVDVHRFEALVRDGQDALAAGDAERAALVLGDALSLWRGTALADAPDAPSTTAAVSRLDERRLGAVEDRIEAALALGRHGAVVAELDALVAEHPLRERLRGQLMLALYRCGRQAEALRCYEDGRALLVEDLGIDPGPALRALHLAILDHDPALTPAAPTPEPSSTPGATASAAPPADTRPFVGRARELAALEAVAAEARVGRGRVVLVAGEAGIGKTRLVEEAAATAAAPVVWGRCVEDEAAPPYWPWVGVLRALPDTVPADVAATVLRPLLPELTTLVPELKDAVGGSAHDLAAPVIFDPATDRFRLFEAVIEALRGIAEHRLLLVAIDDAHWADSTSLRLLRLLAGRVGDRALVVFVTYRDTDAAPLLDDTLGALARERTVERIRLGALSVEAVAEMVGGADAATRRIARLHERTGGNPFFIEEVLRSDDTGVPESIDDMVRRRVGSLGDTARTVLTQAAVLGREFDLGVLARLRDEPPDAVLDILEAATAAGVVAEAPGRVGRFRFSHDLVRDALTGAASATRLAMWHAAAARVYDAIDRETLGTVVFEQATHWLAAGAAGDVRRAVSSALAAARRARLFLDLDQAIELGERALVLIGEHGGFDRARELDVRMEIGEAWRRAGRLDLARPIALQAAATARELGDLTRLARAVGMFGGGALWAVLPEWGAVDVEAIAQLEDALARLPDGDSIERSAVESKLAIHLYFTDQVERRLALSANALRIARGIDVNQQFRVSMARHFVIFGPDSLTERLALADEMVALAARSGYDGAEPMAHFHRAVDRLEAGDVAAWDESRRAVSRLVAQSGAERFLPQVVWHEAARAMLIGDFTASEQLSVRAYEFEQPISPGDAQMAMGGQLNFLNTIRGGVPGLEAAFRAGMADQPHAAIEYRVGLALFLCVEGRLDEARPLFDAIAADGLDRIPRNMIWSTLMVMLTICAAALDDADRAAELDALLEPIAGTVALFGTGHYIWGAADLYRGLAAGTLGQWDVAIGRLGSALALNERLGSMPFVAITHHWMAKAHRLRGDPGDADQADAHAQTAEELMSSLGMRGF